MDTNTFWVFEGGIWGPSSMFRILYGLLKGLGFELLVGSERGVWVWSLVANGLRFESCGFGVWGLGLGA